MSSGSLTSARAIVSRRFMPPESGSTCDAGAIAELDELEQLIRARLGNVPGISK